MSSTTKTLEDTFIPKFKEEDEASTNPEDHPLFRTEEVSKTKKYNKRTIPLETFATYEQRTVSGQQPQYS